MSDAGVKWTPAEIEERIAEIIVAKEDVPRDRIRRETSFVGDLGMDSLSQIELLMEVEDEFDIKVPEADQDKLKTFGEIVDYVRGAVGKGE